MTARSDTQGRHPSPRTTARFDQRRDATRVLLHLPVPVSVNALHAPRKGGGIRRSDAYTAWLDEAGWRLVQQRPGRIAGSYALTLYLPRETGLDLDNGIKATSDLLQRHGVIRDDREAEHIVLRYQGETPEAVVEVLPCARCDHPIPTREAA